MRTNMPVTNVEHVLQTTETIVSKTDLNGNITYINRDFIRISGFDEEELLGAPQNIVRHPDMPVEAFADFWKTLKSGRAWTGFVKNRCKNGDHYWVLANASPVIENGKVTGYASVRVKPDREQVKAAERAYRAVKSGDKSIEISEGKAVRRTSFSFERFARRLSITAVLGTLLGVSVLVSGSLGALALLGATHTGWLLALAALNLGFSGTLGWLMFRRVVKPLVAVRHDIHLMSAGDLSGNIEVSGLAEVVDLIEALRVQQINTKLLVGQIREVSGFVNVASEDISSGSSDLSERVESQASSLEKTASSMEELTSTVKQNADNARQANQVVSATAEVAARGGDVVEQVVETMASIKQSSSKIADIIGVIDSIAFQTNILALNAAVEAARAGEQGRGFAVVASEVRNLAQRSAGAAKEIKALIEDSVDKVDSGGRLVDAAGQTMHDIVTSVKRASDIMNEIAAASAEQSAGIEQVNEAVGQMDEMTQQNAALVEESASAAETLHVQARQLTKLINSFRLVSGAGDSAAMTVSSLPSRARPSEQGGVLNQKRARAA